MPCFPSPRRLDTSKMQVCEYGTLVRVLTKCKLAPFMKLLPFLEVCFPTCSLFKDFLFSSLSVDPLVLVSSIVYFMSWVNTAVGK